MVTADRILIRFFKLNIGVTLVNETVLVSSAQLHNVSSAYCFLHSAPKVQSLPAASHAPLPSPSSPYHLGLRLTPHCCM